MAETSTNYVIFLGIPKIRKSELGNPKYEEYNKTIIKQDQYKTVPR